MNSTQLKEEIIAYSIEIGIDKIGFTTAEPFEALRKRLYQQRALGYQSGFEEKDIEKRTHPQDLLEGAKTIISIALAYPTRMNERAVGTKENRRGIFCRASWGVDYHYLVKDKLQKLEAFILKMAPEAHTKLMVDTGELSDRAVAERAGIGWVGKNTNLITPEYGSFVYLGELLMDLEIEPDNPMDNQCGDCRICIDRCPTQAIVQGGQLNANKCIAYLTQTKELVPEPYRKSIGNRLYGCDTCQQVCPYNRGVDFHHHQEMEPEPDLVKPKLKPLLKISNREFKERFGPLSGSWRGKKPIQRNAIIALGNFKDETAVFDLVESLSKDPRPAIRGTAAWSLGKIATKDNVSIRMSIITALEKAELLEKDSVVLVEIENALKLAGEEPITNSSKPSY